MILNHNLIVTNIRQIWVIFRTVNGLDHRQVDRETSQHSNYTICTLLLTTQYKYGLWVEGATVFTLDKHQFQFTLYDHFFTLLAFFKHLITVDYSAELFIVWHSSLLTFLLSINQVH